MRRAFTLIELLVVIAIIAVLIGLLLPMLGVVRQRGRSIQCLTNQRAIGQALTMYADTFKEWTPREAQVRDYNPEMKRTELRYMSWARALRPLLDERASWDEPLGDLYADAPYFHDPARPKDGHNLHYVNNGIAFTAPGVFDRRFKRMTKMGDYPRPAETLYLSCYTDDPNGTWYNQVYGDDDDDFTVALFYDVRELEHIDGERNLRRIEPDRHLDGAMGLFLDGHAEVVRKDEIQILERWDDGDYTR